MKRAAIIFVVVTATVALAGCTYGGSSGGADIQLTSIGQNTVDGGDRVKVVGIAENVGDGSANVTATVTLLNGSDEIAKRTIPLGELGTDESSQFSATFDVSPSATDGQTVSFDW